MIHLPTYILVAIFGSSSWLSTNAIWMELSLMVDRLPEGWSLPSYLAVVIQIACIGPLFYSIVHKCTRVEVPQAIVIEGLLVLCTACMLATSVLWDKRSLVFGAEHSVALLVLMFLMALVNATSNVLFLPYMSALHPAYLTAYFVGMGLSSLIPSLFSLAQGTGVYHCVPNNATGGLSPVYHAPRFGVQGFNLIMSAWLVVTIVAFAVLHWGRHRLTDEEESTETKQTPTLSDDTTTNTADESSPLNTQPTVSVSVEEDPRSGFQRYVILLACLAVTCLQMNGVVPSILSFAEMSYSRLTYHFSLTLSNLAQAVACFVPLVYQPKTVPSLVGLTGVTSLFTVYVFILALQSPAPLLLHSIWGPFLAVSAAVLAAAFQAYLRTVLTTVIREDNPNSESRLFWCGVFMQIGSFIGSSVMFPLVNIVGLFRSAVPCVEY